MPQFQLTPGTWQKIASAGASVEVQNLSVAGTKLTVSATAPAANADAEVLFNSYAIRRFAEALPNDLYAMPLGSASVVMVMPVGVAGSGTGASSSPATSATSSKAAATTATSLLAANPARKRYFVVNDGTATMYVLEGTGTVSTTNYTYQVPAGGYYVTTDWLGAVSAIWSAANGNARITEYTA